MRKKDISAIIIIIIITKEQREGKGRGGETLVEEDKCQLLTIRMIKRIVKSKGRRVKRIIIRKSHCSLNYLLFLIVFVCIICCFTLK